MFNGINKLFEIVALNAERIKFCIILALVVSLPFHYHVSSVLILCGTALFLIESIEQRTFRFGHLDILTWCLFAFFAMEIIGMFYTQKQNIAYGLSFLEKHHALVLVPLIFCGYYPNKQERSELFRWFCLACLAACLICIVANVLHSQKYYQTFIHPWRFSHLRLAEPVGLTPVYFSLYIGMAIMILLEKLVGQTDTFKGRLWHISLMFLFLIFLIALGARTVTVTVMIITIFRIVVYAKRRRSYKSLWIAILPPVIFASFVLLNPVARMRFMDMTKLSYEDSNYGSYFARWKIWEPGLKVIRDNILLGVGTGDHQAELNKAFLEYNFAEGVDIFNMHNQYLQTLITLGVLGFLIFVYALIHQMHKAISRRDLLYMSFLFLFSLGCLTESLMNRNKGLIFFLVFSFIFYNQEKRTKNYISNAPR